jgi:hypothetical protein
MKKLHRLLALVAATMVALPALAQVPAMPRILGASVESRAAPKAFDSTTAQRRAVRPDLSAIEGLARLHALAKIPSRFTIDLFPGIEVVAEVVESDVRPTGSTVFARLPGIDLGSAVLTLEGGLLTVSVDMPAGNFIVQPQADGTHEVARKAAENYPVEREPRVAFAARPAADPFALQQDAQPDVPVDSGRLIDVMVVWTPNAQVAAPGIDSAAKLVYMQSLAQASVDNANLTYLNSGIAQRLRLVHRQQVAYTEHTMCADGDAFGCALDDVTDGSIPNVHALRNTHGADLVALLIHDNAFCGLAWLPFPSAGTAHLGFSVTGWDCAVGNKSFVHELGHNMGAHHDPYVIGAGSCGDGKDDGAYCYSRGIVNLTQRWRTVMSYNNQCTATSPFTSCTRIQYFSNPKLTYTGSLLGNAQYNNNAHSLNKTAKAIAAYRATSLSHPVAARFSDVPTTHPFFGHIEFMAQAGITSGCGAGHYCPDAAVTRRAMAAFLERTMRASNWTPPSGTTIFTDVLPGSQFIGEIEAMRTDGITSGCTLTTYCPENAVTRAQMAVFLLRARCGSGYVPNPPVTQSFSDVPLVHPFARYIYKLYGLGITGGCATGPLRYCPDAPVTRAQMAVFIERSYPMLTPSDVCTL